ncbi:MAG: hypothetical protein SGI71_00595 [Verrucomicrobiota bacterium]|nr:hypothetical protein [Verrucomicrobiota bacterium]
MGQAFKTKGSQRFFISGALQAMGYALPASIVLRNKNTALKQTIFGIRNYGSDRLLKR